MKILCCLWLATTSVACGVEIGNTQEQVIAEKGNPKTQVAAGSRRVLQYPDMSIVLKNGHVTTIRSADGSVESSAQSQSATPGPKFASPKEEMDAAIARVKEIVNQPPPSQKDSFGIPGYVVKNAWAGWYSAGATKPDFNTVDVRKTQQLPYIKYTMVTSDLNLGTIYPASELEFNPMLKYFYTDRTQPKKRLSDSEMVEINRLYRIIGRCEQQLGELPAR
jgi:hypothetical protein